MKLKRLFRAVGVIIVLLLGPRPAVGGQLLSGHVPEAVSRWHLRPLGRLPATNQLNLTIGLPVRNQPALATLLQQLYDPASTNYHCFLTPAQFTEKFGPTEKDYQAAMAFARRSGFEVTGTHRNRHLLDVRASVGAIEKALRVRLQQYPHPTEHRAFFAPDREPTLDDALPILHIGGLDNFIQPRPLNHLKTTATGAKPAPAGTGSGPGGGFLGNDFRAAYLPDTTLTGSGQTVGLVEFDAGFFAGDISSYATQAGLTNVPITTVLLDGYDGGMGGFLENAEVSLDIEMAMSMAPGLAGIIVYEGSAPDDIFNEMAAPSHGQPLSLQLSASWTYGLDPNTDPIFEEMAAQGQSFFNASGDTDAYYPPGAASDVVGDTNITVVGGTTLTTSGPGGSWQSETVWNWGGGTGSSGGVSQFSIPAWQQGLDMSANQGSTTLRNLPDVALTADNVWVSYGDGGSAIFGGTSCATPLWAGLTALINQQAETYGWPPMGFLNPALYALGESPAYAATFHDITTGNNVANTSGNLYWAVPGYDLCTGWGTPDGQSLIDTLVPPDYLVITPSAGFLSSGNPGGPFNITSQTLTLANGSANPIVWSVTSTSLWLDVSITGATSSPPAITIPLVNPSFETPAGSQGTAAGVPDGWTVSLKTPWGVFNPSAGLYTNVVNDLLPSPADGSQVLWINAGNYVSQFLTNTLVPGQTYTLSGAIGNRGDMQGLYPSDQDYVYLLAGSTILAGIDNLPHPDPGSFLPWTFAYTAPITGVPSGTLEIRLGQMGAGQVHYDNIQLVRANPSPTTLLPGGATTVTVSLNSLASTLATGAYTATLWFTNENDSVAFTRTYTLEVLGAPIITMQPQDQTLDNGDTASFTVTAAGATPMNYCWQQNGVPVPGATNATGVFSNLPVCYSGSQFACAVSNVYGATTSSVAVLTVENPFYSFHGPDGSSPMSALTQGSDGNFYGTTEFGGAYNDGTVFQITTNGVLTTLVSFDFMNGANPGGALLQGPDGNFYGTTLNGGASASGTVFQLSPDGELTTLISFNYVNGANPGGPLALGSDGYIYGTTQGGGIYFGGTVYRVSTNGTVTPEFASFEAGDNAQTGLVQGDDGNFYGTTFTGGTGGYGSVFQLTPDGLLTTLVSFNVADGWRPQAPLAQSGDGSFYGTTSVGGDYGYGTIFQVTTNGTLTTLLSFGDWDGAFPQGSLVAAGDGSIYGTTESGGIYTDGTVYRLRSDGTLASLLTFFGPNGNGPQAGLIQGTDGNLYGSTTSGGILSRLTNPGSGYGTLFEITLTNPPVITQQPIGQAVRPGGPASFAVGATGTKPLSYQWQFQGMDIPGATATNYSIPNTTTAEGGGYTVAVTNQFGSITSSMAVLTVVLPPGVTVSGGVPVVFFPTAAASNYVLQMSANPRVGYWGGVTNYNPWCGLGITNGPCTAFFRLNSNAVPCVTSVAGGNDFSLLLKSDGSLWGMGGNENGELGNGTLVPTNQPALIVAGNVTAIAAGDFHSLFLKSDGSLWGMGYNASGQLGDGTYVNHLVPEQIVASNVLAIAARGQRSFFFKGDGSLWAMGDDTSGDLGDGRMQMTNQPEQIMASNVTAVALGASHSLFLKADGSLWGVGYNGMGDLGDGTFTDDTNLPEQIVASNVTTIAAGASFSLFLKNDGTLWGMGANYFGNLGDGTDRDARTWPEQIMVSNVTAFAAGADHTLLLKSDGSLWVMGYNVFGQLGDGTYNDSDSPEEIETNAVVGIAGGSNHSLFILGDGSLWAMGANSEGELGDGSYTMTNQPERIIPAPPPPLASIGVGTYGSQPVILYPQPPVPAANAWLLMTTNLSSGIWVPATNGIPFTGVQVTNASGPLFFRLE
jgi:uncharacterized repeat protein (TIGR03803 family)